MSKVSKVAVDYQNYPHQHRRCSQCTMWQPPHGCSHVEGEISPHGYCEDFKLDGYPHLKKGGNAGGADKRYPNMRKAPQPQE